MVYVDVHCHLLMIKRKSLDEVLSKCKEEDVKVVIENGLNPEYNRKILEKFSNNEIVKIALGIHPTDLSKLDEEKIKGELRFIKENSDKIVAIGEVGLDYYWIRVDSLKEKQRKYFVEFLNLAEELDLPILVHSRWAEKDTINFMKDYDKVPIILHCFNGSLKLVKEVINKKNVYFSIPPIIVRSSHFQKLVEILPLDKILTETDSPFLSPRKGEENYPWNVKITIEKIAEIKNIEKEKVKEKIFENFNRIFKIT